MKKSDVCVYISGKYTDAGMIGVHKNIVSALEIAIQCADNGIFYFCPHTHSQFMDHYSPSASHSYWMTLDLRVIYKLTNCMIMVDNYQTSAGAQLELKAAELLDHPVFYSFNDFKNWYDSLDS